MTWSIVLPLVIGLLFQRIGTGTIVAIGALCVGLSDSPGTWSEKAKGLIGGSFLNTIAAIGMAICIQWPIIAVLYLTIISFASAIISIFGNRATMIGNSVLIAISLGVGFGEPISDLPSLALYLLAGGLWYSLNSLVLWQIRPYASIEKLLGECYVLMSQYFKIKASLFNGDISNDAQNKLFQLQTQIDHKQEEVRTLLLTQRSALQGATPLGRSLILLLRASTDIFEKASATHYSYQELSKQFKDTPLLPKMSSIFNDMGNNLAYLGKHITKRKPTGEIPRHLDDFKEVQDIFESLRDDQYRVIPIDVFAEVKNIIRNFNRIDRTISETATYTDLKNDNNKGFANGLILPNFITSTDQGTLKDHLTINSSHFRHAIRISIAMLLGYVVANFLDLDRGYWVWLSISVILKPSFAITKQRMLQRIIGTTFGIIISAILLKAFNASHIYIIFLLIFGVGTFSTLSKDYRLGMMLLTPFILLMISLSVPFTEKIALYRVIDTALGGIIAFLTSIFIYPEFEIKKINNKIIEATRSACSYFSEVATVYTGYSELDEHNYKLARKKAQLANANLAVSFQIMLNDPKNNQVPSSSLYEFIAASRMLFAHTATLASNAERLSKKHPIPDLQNFIKDIQQQLNSIIEGIEQQKPIEIIPNLSDHLTMLIEETEQIKKDREEELSNNIKESHLIKILSDYVLITNQFMRISKNVKFMGNYANELILG
ncbi:FUSC family membrane protein [Flammeovirga sp. SubArs3]|uniref:FUSC family membrane protein n=1 Tax=Flammeovirga sp. SubArs3 TaxID=2995316 RepID=UPI00248C21A6|nr:FUSC family membrane protein [Flammeovirga sp. SubArs3]